MAGILAEKVGRIEGSAQNLKIKILRLKSGIIAPVD
jgi:hypothetical protein